MEELKPYLASLTQYMINSGMELAPLPKVIFKNDETNAEDVLSRTAHYNPNNNSITLFISKRHPKDILRSYAHEMIHHNQNLENRLNNITTTNINEDDYLKEIEREAYEKGNMIFRGWENNYKQNIKENKMTDMVENTKNTEKKYKTEFDNKRDLVKWVNSLNLTEAQNLYLAILGPKYFDEYSEDIKELKIRLINVWSANQHIYNKKTIESRNNFPIIKVFDNSIKKDGKNIHNILAATVTSDTFYGKTISYEKAYKNYTLTSEEFELPLINISFEEFKNKCLSLKDQIFIYDMEDSDIFVIFGNNGVNWYDDENSNNPLQSAIKFKQNIKENKMTVKELRKLIREAIYNELNENEDKTWEIIYIDKGIQKSVLVKGYSAIVETNKWRNQNPDKEFIQIQLYSLNELEVKNEDPSTLKPAIVFDSNKKQHFISLVNKSGKVNSLGPLISEDDIKKVNAGNTNDFCKKANQLYSNLDENVILENTNLKVVKIVDSCKLDENKHKNVSLLNLANEYVAEHGDVTPEELAKGLKIDLKTAKKLVMDLEDDFKNYYGNEEDLTEDLSSKLDENKINLRKSLRKIIKEELQNTSLINEDLDTDIANVNKQIETLITQMSPLQKKKADLEKKKADLTKKKADQDLAASKITTESTANATGTGATMTAGTGEQYATKFAFKKKKKTKLNENDMSFRKKVKSNFNQIVTLYDTPEEDLSHDDLSWELIELLQSSESQIEKFLDQLIAISDKYPEASTEDWLNIYLRTNKNR